MVAKRAVIFDFGGVIFKTRDYTPRHAWDARLGLAPGSVERVVHGIEQWNAAQRGDISVDGYWAAVAAALNITPQAASTQLAHDFYSGDQLDEDVIAFIGDLRVEGVTVALLSNDCAALLRPRLERLGITPLFDPLVISSEIGVMKPHPDAYTAVLDRLNRPAKATLFIDDREENITGAAALGIHGVHYRDGMALAERVRPLLPIGP
jgi:HAD superfamily hydrolase (TIGR01509 family)